jgi:hypothetical protein
MAPLPLWIAAGFSSSQWGISGAHLRHIEACRAKKVQVTSSEQNLTNNEQQAKEREWRQNLEN